MELHQDETAEQREARLLAEELKRLGTLDGQADEFREALKQALTMVNRELAGKGLQPNVLAVMRALTQLMAEFVAMVPDRNSRRMRLVEIEHNLKKLVALRTSVGTRTATEIPPADAVN